MLLRNMGILERTVVWIERGSSCEWRRWDKALRFGVFFVVVVVFLYVVVLFAFKYCMQYFDKNVNEKLNSIAMSIFAQ